MRKALLVIVLVAASFAGGAAVNGPGLTWAKGMIGGRMHESESIPTLNLADPGTTATKSNPFPSAPAPSLLPDLPPAPTNTEPKPETKPLALAQLPSDTKPQPGSPQAEAPALELPPELPPLTPSTPPLSVREPVREDPALTTAIANPASATSSSDWATIRVRMKALGVSRYWIESTPEGPSKFRCAIPVAGSGSVFQQFEADGDDDLRAAEAALRRITLWKATEKE